MSEADDPRRPMQFGSLHKTALKALPFSLGATAIGALLAYWEMSEPYPDSLVLAWGIFCAGLAFTISVLVRLGQKNRHSLFLSPFGLQYADIGKAIIPWSEVISVDTVDAVFGVGRGRHTVNDATALTVSRAFYDSRFETGNLMTSPTAYNIGHFTIRDDQVQIVIDHESLHAKADIIRMAVDARWRMFGAPVAVAARDAAQKVNTPSYFERFMEDLGAEFRKMFRPGK
jgi:hypothetical protein